MGQEGILMKGNTKLSTLENIVDWHKNSCKENPLKD